MDDLKKIYKECSLKYSFVYPRYVSECHPREVTSEDINFDGHFVYPEDFVFVDKTNELWFQKSKFSNGMVVPDNELEIKKTDEEGTEVVNYISNTETYINPELDKKTYWLNNLLDDPEYLTKRSCGYWIGNTNTLERYQEMKTVEIDGEKYTVTMGKIWGFEPDLADSSDDISNGIIEGFSKRKYTLFVKHNDAENYDLFIPTVDNNLLTEAQLQEIIESHSNYPNYEAGKYVLLVSD